MTTETAAERDDAERGFKLIVNDREIRWHKQSISGAALYTLAEIEGDDVIVQAVPGGEDRLIEPDEVIDLSGPAVERFHKTSKPAQTFEIIVNSRPRQVDQSLVTFQQVVQLAFPDMSDPNVVFSMTYNHAASKPHAGNLGAGGTVEVKKRGTIFNVKHTFRS